MSKFIVGLTGGIGSGKTTVSNIFAQQFDITVIDADVIARQVVEPGSPALTQIKDYFGEQVITIDGQLNRGKLREVVFQSDTKKQWLNSLLHPLIRDEMRAQCLAAPSTYAILSIPLMTENKLQGMANRVLVVDCSETVQRQRAATRDGVGDEQIKRIMASQATREQRLAIADDVIVNEGPVTDLASQVEALHDRYMQLVKIMNNTEQH